MRQKSLSWASYLKKCEKLCPHNLSFSMLLFSVPFYQAYENQIPPHQIMAKIWELDKDTELTIEERQTAIARLIKL